MNTLEEIIEALKFHTPPISCEAKYMFKYMTQERELTEESLEDEYLEKAYEWKPINNNKMSELKVTKEKVLEAAKVSKEGKEVLEKLFPEVFEEYYDFGEEFTIDTTCVSPFFIAKGFAKAKGDVYKVLIVDPDYSVEVISKYNGFSDGIKLRKKTKKQ